MINRWLWQVRIGIGLFDENTDAQKTIRLWRNLQFIVCLKLVGIGEAHEALLVLFENWQPVHDKLVALAFV